MSLGEATLVSRRTRAGRTLLWLSIKQINAALLTDGLSLGFFVLILFIWLQLAEDRSGLLVVDWDGDTGATTSATDILLGGLTELATVATRA